MKKLLLSFVVASILSSGNISFASMFDYIDNLSENQQYKLTQIYYDYKQEKNAIENQIMDYSNKISFVTRDQDRTPEQAELIIGAYERNIEALRAQLTLLEKTTDELFKLNMSQEQFDQFLIHKENVQRAFSNFLQK